ncbi:MAG: helix-turn-helix transcriptional regulator [Solobacterium sp.]|nr:helix-turn-helix transcriptional regulator [Solobacterium sp.]
MKNKKDPAIEIQNPFDTLARIKYYQDLNEMTTYKLAKLTNIPQSTIATWFDKNLCPPIPKLELICAAFNITLPEFFQINDEFVVVSGKQAEVMSKYNALSSSNKTIIDEIMDVVLKNQ